MERRQNTAGVRVGDRELRRDVEVVAGADNPVTHGLDDGVAERGHRVVRRGRVEVAVPGAESAARPSAWPRVADAVPKPMRGIGLPKLRATTGTPLL